MGAVRREGQTNQAGISISIIISQRTPSKHCSHEQVLMSTGHPTLTQSQGYRAIRAEYGHGCER